MGFYGKIVDLQKLFQPLECVRQYKPSCGVYLVAGDHFDADVREEEIRR